MIENIIFDLNKVIVTYENHPDKNQLDNEHIGLLGLSQKEFWKTAMEYFDEYNEGRVNFSGYMKIVFDELDIPYSRIPMMQELHARCFHFVEGMQEILDSLSSKYKMILLAGDGFEAEKMKLDAFDIRKYFDKIYMTCHERTNKEDPAIYQKVLAQNNLEPDKTLFIDDLTKHTRVAEQSGIHAIQFKNSRQLKMELGKYNILI